MTLGSAQALAPIPGPVDRHAAREVDVCQTTLACLVARDHEGALHSSGSRAEGLGAAEGDRALFIDQARGLAFPGRGVGAPHPEEQGAGGDRRALVTLERAGTRHRQSLDGVEVTVEDPAHRAVGARDASDQPQLIAEGDPATVRPGQRRAEDIRARERRERVARERRTGVELIGAGGDALERSLQPLPRGRRARRLGSAVLHGADSHPHAVLSDSGMACTSRALSVSIRSGISSTV